MLIMQKKMHKFESIDQFKNCVVEVRRTTAYEGDDETSEPIYNYSAVMPTLKFIGTVKLHGTNASVCELNDERWYQSRNNIIDLQNDNCGFAAFCVSNKDNFTKLFSKIYEKYNKQPNITYIIYGEWCGGNIQNGVAISKVDKMFVIFDVQIKNEDQTFYCPAEFVKTLSDAENRIFNTYMFETYEINIDFNIPQLSQEPLCNFTEAVERECPVGKYFGEPGVGEGIVWTHRANGSFIYQFKVKGQEHSVSKVKKLASVSTEVINDAVNFVDYAVTDNRLNQGLENIPELSKKHIGEYVRWVVGDVMKEESDAIVANKLDVKIIIPLIQKKAQQFILSKF